VLVLESLWRGLVLLIPFQMSTVRQLKMVNGDFVMDVVGILLFLELLMVVGADCLWMAPGSAPCEWSVGVGSLGH
jgi:hypothetical protein